MSDCNNKCITKIVPKNVLLPEPKIRPSDLEFLLGGKPFEPERRAETPNDPVSQKIDMLFGGFENAIPEISDIREELERIDATYKEPEYIELEENNIGTTNNDSTSTSGVLVPVEIESENQDVQDPTEEIISAVVDGDAFVNPVASSAVSANGAIVEFEQTYTDTMLLDMATDQYLANPVGTPASLTDIQEFLLTVSQLKQSINNFRDHTDVLSGIKLGDINITSLLSSVKQANVSIGSCAFVGGVFGAILKAQQFSEKLNSIANSLSEFLGDINGLLQQFSTSFSSLRQELEDEILFNLEEYSRAQLFLLQRSIGSLLSGLFNDECLSVVFDKITTPKIKTLLKR